MFVDSHCHIDGPEYDADRAEVIARAHVAGVTTMLNVGTGDPHSGAFERAIELAERYSEIYCAIGVHPHDAKHFDGAAEQRLIDLQSRVRVWSRGVKSDLIIITTIRRATCSAKYSDSSCGSGAR